MKNRFSLKSVLPAALLLLCMLLSACAGETEPEASTAVTTAAVQAQTADENQPPEETTAELAYLEEIALNTTLSMLYWSDVENIEFFVEESTGDMVADSIWTRNISVEERLKVTFEYEGTPGNYDNNAKFVTAAKNAKAGGTNYDLYAAYSMTTASLAYAGLCRDLTKYEIIDFSKPWWPDPLISEAKICDKLFFLSGDLSTNMLYMLYPVYFNKDLIAQYKLESPYDLVKSNGWTIDKLFELASVASTEGSLSGEYSVLGMAETSNVHIDSWFYAAGLRTVDRNADGTLIISPLFGSERAGEVAAKMQQYLHEPYNTFEDKNNSFKNGMAIFVVDRARYASKHLGGAEFEYGVVPMPKYSADQENYSTCIGYPYTLYAITDSSTQPEAAATALESLGCEGYRYITPALFELTMKSRYVSDNEAAQMFDIIRTTASFDVGRIYTSQLDNMPYSIFRNYVKSDPNGVSYLTQYSTAQKSLKKRLEKLEETFSAFEG